MTAAYKCLLQCELSSWTGPAETRNGAELYDADWWYLADDFSVVDLVMAQVLDLAASTDLICSPTYISLPKTQCCITVIPTTTTSMLVPPKIRKRDNFLSNRISKVQICMQVIK